MQRLTLTLAIFALACACRGGEPVAEERPYPITGLLKDVFYDPTDSLYVFLYLQATNRTYYVPLTKIRFPDTSELEASVGAQVRILGTIFQCEARPFSADEFRVGTPKNVSILSPPPENPFDCPDDTNLLHKRPEFISMQGPHCVRGKVLAAWNGDRVLIRSQHGNLVEAELREQPLPRFGETVDLVGLPETTLYTLRLNRALWRTVAPPGGPDETGEAISARAITTDEVGHPVMNRNFHGKVVRVRGIVRSLPRTATGDATLYLDDDSYIVPVNTEAAAAALGDVRIGCTVEATGTCVMDIDTWRPNAVFPRIRGYALVTRKPGDIRILAYPPWLTPRRMFVIVCILFAVIVAILIWNSALRIRSERRGRQLAKEQILRAEADLKVHERTRLAVELHDALSQNLTGVALELKTVAALAKDDPALAQEHLAIADRSLLSCREELHNCLYDLRNDALGAKDMNEAIRMTLEPHAGKTAVSVRFNVLRSRISDNTAHALLCIVRELTLNAIRHGHAANVRIAGTVENRKLMFSVCDDGRGFDPANRPGVRQGHFGLQGVRERVLALGGELAVKSRPGAGAKVTVSIGIPGEATNG